MKLNEHDLHAIFQDAENLLKFYVPNGEEIWRCEARNAAVGGSGTGRFAEAPGGTFILGKPVLKNSPPFGKYFTPLEQQPGHHEMDDRNRAGIGVHGGGSASPDWSAPDQGFYATEGCIRLLNSDNKTFVGLVKKAQAAGGTVWFTVVSD